WVRRRIKGTVIPVKRFMSATHDGTEDTREYFRSYQACNLRRGARVADLRGSDAVLADLIRNVDRATSNTRFHGPGLRRRNTDLWRRRE
ncbi:hypothetical protein, partial [Chryseobacterium sp. SIMBA_029]|uniref:hypothetical protein n=1 Tax=Chryseobacterium sp. SIMBA_029 TaxID=3085772 RepID=UPI00397AFEB1